MSIPDFELPLIYSLNAEEADLLCPPVENELGDEDACPNRETETPSDQSELKDSEAPNDLVIVTRLKTWLRKWHFATKFIGHMTPTGYRRPIPFDHVFFSRLDRWISFHPDEVSREEPVPENLCSPDLDPRMAEVPAEPIHHDLPNSLVVPHPPLAPWEDIPPYQRMRGYSDQPAYTDDYDDFLWLPRDPLSTLDMDDTVEMRLSITTSAGGSGRISDWPCEPLEDEVTTLPVIHERDWQEVMTDNGPVSPNTTVDTNCSPGAQSERRLIDDVELSPLIGSEIGGVRRAGSTLGLRNVAIAMSAFRRPRPQTVTSAESGISMQDLTSHSADMAGHDDTPSRPVRQASETSNVLTGERVGTPNSATQPDFGLPIRSESDPIRQFTQHAGGSARSQTLPLRPLDEENDPFLAPHTAPPLSIRIPGPVPGSSAMSPRTKHASHLTFAAAPGELGRSPTASGLGRTPSGRRPHNRLRSGTINSRNSDRTAGGTQRSGSGILRTSSMLVHERQASVSASQRALLKEVMEEEALASRNVKKDEAALTEREREELSKEKDRLRKSGLEVPGDGGGVARRGSWLESVHEMARGPSVRRPTLEE
jgi:hypothetical protein